MSLLDYFRHRKPASSSIAKERLQIIISHERSQRDTTDYLPQLQKEIIAVIAKYVLIDEKNVVVNLERSGDNSVLELNVTVPELSQSC